MSEIFTYSDKKTLDLDSDLKLIAVAKESGGEGPRSKSNLYLTPIQLSLIKNLENKGPLVRRDIVKQLNFPRTTIYDNLLKLQKIKIVEKYSRNNGVGRPLVLWQIKEQIKESLNLMPVKRITKKKITKKSEKKEIIIKITKKPESTSPSNNDLKEPEFDDKNFVRIPIEKLDDNNETYRTFKTYRIIKRLDHGGNKNVY